MRRRTLLRRGSALAGMALAGCVAGRGSGEFAGEDRSDQRLAAGEYCSDQRLTADGQRDAPVVLSLAPCVALDRAAFSSVQSFGSGFTRPPSDGGIHWTVTFRDGWFSYTQTDTGVMGEYTCQHEGCLVTITATPGGEGGVHFRGTLDPETGVLKWDGHRYRLVSLGGQ